MALRKYEGPAEIYFDGNLLAEATRVRARVRSNNHPVKTMHRQFAGRSKGPRESQIDVTSAIPLEGFENDYYAKVVEDADIVIVLKQGGKRMRFEGYIDEVNSEGSADAEANADFTVMAGPPSFTRG